MSTRTGRRSTRWLAGVLGLAPLLLAPSAVYAIFPPVIHDPGPVVTPTAIPVVNPVVIPAGGPVVPPVTTASTPEPASIVSGLMALGLGGYFLRRKKPVYV